MYRKVFITDPEEYGILQRNDKIMDFHREILQELGDCEVEKSVVKPQNVIKILSEMKKDDILISYNDDKYNESLDKLLIKALEKCVEIWPIALMKETRMPKSKSKDIEELQSYDVYEQIRCRALSRDYVNVAVKTLCRGIAARCFPTLATGSPVIFLSHRRSDGEDVTAAINDKLLLVARDAKVFRDVVRVEVGQKAQKEVDKAMADADVFVFLQTKEAYESDWIMKELLYALTRNIPILWVQFDNASPKNLKIKPAEKPHLSYMSEIIKSDRKLTNAVEEVMDRASKLIFEKSMCVFGYISEIENLFHEKIKEVDKSRCLYKICYPRKGYVYHQREIIQYMQLFGRNPHEEDFNNLLDMVQKNEEDYDSVVIISDKIVRKSEKKDCKSKKCEIETDSYNNFYSAWDRYINGEKEARNMEIIVSGAFPGGDEIYSHNLMDALVLFEKEILTQGYTLTFGAHPTFQEVFFDVAKEIYPVDCNKRLKMFISDYFIQKNNIDTSEFDDKYIYIITDVVNDNINESLTLMREQMIARDNVKALVCLGGKIKENHSEEGIREEIDIALRHNIPVFVVGSVGGCSSIVAEEYHDKGWDKINHAGNEINEMFMNGIDYHKMAQDMINILE